jgi:hypothetical protein
MLGVTVLCVTAAATPAVNQLLVAGWRVFIARPAGVGASTSDASAQRQEASAQSKKPGITVQPQVTPSPTATGQPTLQSAGPSQAVQPPGIQPLPAQPPALSRLVQPRHPVGLPRPQPKRVPPPPSEHVRHRWRG